jgi:hypothetical protein
MNSSAAIDTHPRGAPQSARSEPPVGHAWVAIGAFICMTIVGMFGAAKVMNYLYPASAFALMIFLYHRYPLLFHGFGWWLYFLTPLVRRIVDYKSSFTDPSPILLAPVLIGVVILPGFLKNFPNVILKDAFPFGISAIAVIYAVFVGYMNHVASNKLILAALGWLSPILYGFYIYVNWRRYPEYQKNLETNMLWGVLVMGVYGVWQYFTLPEWDRLWLVNTEMTTTGNPFPQEFRVWSTMNSGEPFSAVMAAGLILNLNAKGSLSATSSIFGYISFLLTLIRSAWLGWIGGIAFLFIVSKPKFQKKILAMMTAIIIVVVPLIMFNSFSESIGGRFSSLGNLEEDDSATVRVSSYAGLNDALNNWIGQGTHGVSVDSSLLSMLGELGIIGTVPYAFGLLSLMVVALRSAKYASDNSSKIMLAATFTCIVRLPVNNALIGVSGSLLWGCLAFSLAGAKYSRWQTTKKNIPSSST